MSCKSDVRFNFGISSDCDTVVYGSSRPGAASQRCFNPEDKVSEDEVKQWAEFMKSQGVTRAVGLLTQSEIQTYHVSPADTISAQGMKYVNIDLDTQQQPMDRVVQELKEAEEAGEKVVVHCWGGGGRTGKVLAAWLASRHGLTLQEAAQRVEETAKQLGTSRRADVGAVAQLLNQTPQ